MSAKQCQISTPLIVFFLESFLFLGFTLIYFACLAIIRAEGRGNAHLLGRRVDRSTPSTWGMEFRYRIEDIRLGVLRTTDVGNSSDVRNLTYNTHALKVTSTAFYLHTVILIDPSTHPIFTHHMILLRPSYATDGRLEGMFSVVFEYFLEAGP